MSNAVIIALAASHRYIIFQAVVGQMLEKFVWVGSRETEDVRFIITWYLASSSATNGGAMIVMSKMRERISGKMVWVFHKDA